MKRNFIIVVMLVFSISFGLRAQNFGIKTNALYWASTTPNLGVEAALGKKVTLEASVGYNPWVLDKNPENNMKIKHVLVQPEARYWLCESFNGHFFGVHGLYAMYNAGNIPVPFVESARDSRYQGWAAGVGLSYGYSWIIGKRWNIEATLGLGYIYTAFDKYDNRACGIFRYEAQKHLFAPTKLGVSFIYLIK